MTIDDIKFDEKGLAPAICQDAETGDILMFAWMNRESLEKTIETGVMTYWSRSRKKLWVKGESSGNTQTVREMRVDCDGDCLLFKVTTNGVGAACHDGYRSCFFRALDDGSKEFTITDERVFDPHEVYGKQ
ncbi:MAG: phosphoribosyl-AMP cyclohydrolase [Candidatus Latescibacterota bacterium]